MSKEYQFRPDPARSSNLDKLFLSQQQRFHLLRWTLYALVCVLALVVQDVVLCRINYRGAGTDIVPCLIIMITALEGGESGSIFALTTSLLYCFSGSAPGVYVIPVITFISVYGAIFRQACLRQGFFSILLCTAGGMALYELCVFGIGLFMGYLSLERLEPLLLTAALSLVAVPVSYPLARVIGKIGGETWKE